MADDVKPEVVVCDVETSQPDELESALRLMKTRGWAALPTVTFTPTVPADIDRRVKVVCLDALTVLDWFIFALKGFPGYISLPCIEDIPRDAKVLSVRENHLRRQFEFVVAHPSFDVVPEGQYPPDVTGRTMYRRFEIRSPRES